MHGRSPEHYTPRHLADKVLTSQSALEGERKQIVEDRDTAERMREKATGKVLTLDEGLGDIIPPILSLLEALADDDRFRALDPSQQRGRTVDALKPLVFRESRRQPLLLVFEDLHWTDSESRVALDALVESLPTSRVLLLANYRPDYEDRWAAKTHYTRLRVDPLPAESADALLDALLGTSSSLAPLKALLKAAEGKDPGKPVLPFSSTLSPLTSSV